MNRESYLFRFMIKGEKYTDVEDLGYVDVYETVVYSRSINSKMALIHAIEYYYNNEETKENNIVKIELLSKEKEGLI